MTMGFAATTSDKITALDETIGLVQSLKILLNQKDLEKTITDAYALSESEAASAAEARKLIPHYEGLIAEHQKKKSALDALEKSLQQDGIDQAASLAAGNADIAKKQKDIDAGWVAINDANKKLDDRKSELDAQSTQAAADTKAAKIIMDGIAAEKSAIEVDRNAIIQKWKEVNDYEAALKATAAAITKATAGISG